MAGTSLGGQVSGSRPHRLGNGGAGLSCSMAYLSRLQWCTEGPRGFCRGGLFLRSLFKASATRWSPAYSQMICARSSASWSPLRWNRPWICSSSASWKMLAAACLRPRASGGARQGGGSLTTEAGVPILGAEEGAGRDVSSSVCPSQAWGSWPTQGLLVFLFSGSWNEVSLDLKSLISQDTLGK